MGPGAGAGEVTDYVANPRHYTKRERQDMKWSWYCDAWKRIAWLHAHPWHLFVRVWHSIGWQVLRPTLGR